MARRLERKVALVTGASSGIGAATARRFAEEGAFVNLGARRTDVLERQVADIRAAGGRAEELAHAILFFASDESSFVPGETLVVDGGKSMRISRPRGDSSDFAGGGERAS